MQNVHNRLAAACIAVMVGTSIAAAAPVKSEPSNSKAQVSIAREGAVEIRKAMRDPDSVKFESIQVSDDGKIACFKYRAKNGFGGYKGGKIVIIDRKVSAMDADFAKNCNKPMNDWTVAGD